MQLNPDLANSLISFLVITCQFSEVTAFGIIVFVIMLVFLTLLNVTLRIFARISGSKTGKKYINFIYTNTIYPTKKKLDTLVSKIKKFFF